MVTASLAGAAWTLWERSQHDPWLRLLGQARARLKQAGIDVPEATPPRQMAARLDERFGTSARPAHDWLLRLEAQRYAKAPGDALSALRTEFRRLAWPR